MFEHIAPAVFSPLDCQRRQLSVVFRGVHWARRMKVDQTLRQCIARGQPGYIFGFDDFYVALDRPYETVWFGKAVTGV